MKLFTLLLLSILVFKDANASNLDGSFVVAQANTSDFFDKFEDKEKAKREELRAKPRGECFVKCNVSVEGIKSCKSKAENEVEKQACFPSDQKECLMTCKDHQLEIRGLKSYEHKSCFTDCKVDRYELKECRTKLKEQGVKDLKGKCLNTQQRQCLKRCIA